MSASEAIIKKLKSLFNILVPLVEEESLLLEPGFGFPQVRFWDNILILLIENTKI